MQVGDLVLYADGNPKGHIGVVVKTHRNSVITVLWATGVESNHSRGWLIRIEGIKCK